MTIQDASHIIAISKDMIRYYEKIGLLHLGRSENGYRDFSEEDLNTLVLIRMLSNSHIPLREIKRAFRKGNVSGLLARLETEMDDIRRLRRQLDAREKALKLEAGCFRHYMDGGEPMLCRQPDRWLVHKSDRTAADFAHDFQDIVQEDAYFQYVLCHDIEIIDGEPCFLKSYQGLLVFYPVPGAEPIPAQDSLRSIVSRPPGRMMSPEEMAPFIRKAALHSEHTGFRLLAYQIFRSMDKQDSCAICLEVPLGD